MTPEAASLDLTVHPTPPTFTAASPPPAGVGSAYSYQFQANGTATITFSATGLPAWAQLSTSGLLTGTPPAVGTTNNIVVTASNGINPNATVTISLAAQLLPPVFTADSPPVAIGGSPYSYQFQATGTGNVPITYSGTGLPAWAHLNASSGFLTGTPTADGNLTFSVTASNGIAPDTTQSVTLTVAGGTAESFNVPANTTFNVPGGIYAGGTTFNVGANATLNINTGTFTGGANFNMAAGSVANLTSSPMFSGTLTGSGTGAVVVGSGRLYIGAGGLTLNFTGNMFQWSSGQMDAGLGDLTNLGTMNITGDTEKDFYNDGVLDNFGTIIQTGAGNLQLGTDGTFPATLKNVVGANYFLEGDSGLSEISDSGSAPGQISLFNAGLVRKSVGTGTSSINVLGSITNTGVIEADSGTISLAASLGIAQLAGNALIAGTWNAAPTAPPLQLPQGFTSNAGNLILSGSGATISGMNGLSSNSGSVTLTGGANFTTAGAFSNSGSLTLGINSTLTVSGAFTQTSGGTLVAQIGGLSASNAFGQAAINGVANLAGTFTLNVVNGFTPVAGQTYQVLSFTSSSGTFARLVGFGSTFTEALGGASLVLGTFSNPVDLAVTNVAAPANAVVGQSIPVTWQTNNQTNQSTTASWQDSVYLSASPTITASSILLGSVVRKRRDRRKRLLFGKPDRRHPGARAGQLLRSGPDRQPVPGARPESDQQHRSRRQSDRHRRSSAHARHAEERFLHGRQSRQLLPDQCPRRRHVVVCPAKRGCLRRPGPVCQRGHAADAVRLSRSRQCEQAAEPDRLGAAGRRADDVLHSRRERLRRRGDI